MGRLNKCQSNIKLEEPNNKTSLKRCIFSRWGTVPRHFTTKLRNFSKRGMLFQAVVIFLPISIFFKILSNGGKVH